MEMVEKDGLMLLRPVSLVQYTNACFTDEGSNVAIPFQMSSAQLF